jgi:phosphoesterase RecJ-like protein
MMKTVDGVKMCFFLKEEPDGRVKVSARSNGTYDVNALAKRFGGGGHPAAAGFRIEAPLADSPAILAEAVREHNAELDRVAAAAAEKERQTEERGPHEAT